MGVALALVLAPATAQAGGGPQTFAGPTNSSPITLSRDNRLLWVVNPQGDTVAVINTKTNAVLKSIKVGDEPQSVAVDPVNKYAYVANAASGNVSAIKITDPRAGSFRAALDKKLVKPAGQITTGSEPWNIVASPDGKRIFVANSSQDTITVIDAVGTKAKPLAKVGPKVIGTVQLRGSRCSADPGVQFQPRGLAVTADNKHLYATGFLAFTRPGGKQGTDTGKQGVVCSLKIKTSSTSIGAYRPTRLIGVAPETTGFTVDSTGDGVPDPTAAFPNQLQSIVIRGNQAFLPNIAASPSGPLRFNVDTQAFVNVLDGVNGNGAVDTGPAKFINLHLGAREPEPGKKKLFFANPWAIGFTNQAGNGTGYVVSSGSDLLVKVNVDATGKLSFTVDDNTTRYIDLNNPANPATAGDKAGKNPLGIVINSRGTQAYVFNRVSSNVSVVNLKNDTVKTAIRIAPLPAPGSQPQRNRVGAEIFFSSRGAFTGTGTLSTSERLSSEGWQSCSSCHFEGWTDGIIWQFNAGPRKSVPLSATFGPTNPNDQRVLNYSAIFDEVEDFEANIRNVSGPGNLAQAQPCSEPPPLTSAFDPNHGLLLGDNPAVNFAPCVINAFGKANANRPQVMVSPPNGGSVPALTAMKEWVQFAVRAPVAPVASEKLGGPTRQQVNEGRALFGQAGCNSCHGTQLWSVSRKDFVSPPAAAELDTEQDPPPPPGTNVVTAQFLPRFLRNINSYNLGVAGAGNEFGGNIGAVEKATQALNANGVAGQPPDALGKDFNNDGNGNGFSPSSLLGISMFQPYYHNGACQSLGCVLNDPKHRTANGTRPDVVTTDSERAAVVAFLRSIDDKTPAFP
jgi:YVTN family beta-propeller protein